MIIRAPCVQILGNHDHRYRMAFSKALIVSPCILPVLPLVLAASVEGGRRRPYGIIIGFVLAFSLFALVSRKIVLAAGHRSRRHQECFAGAARAVRPGAAVVQAVGKIQRADARRGQLRQPACLNGRRGAAQRRPDRRADRPGVDALRGADPGRRAGAGDPPADRPRRQPDHRFIRHRRRRADAHHCPDREKNPEQTGLPHPPCRGGAARVRRADPAVRRLYRLRRGCAIAADDP